jgi:hypothetical protein
MRLLDRRRFVAVAAASVASLKSFAEPASQTGTLTLRREGTGPTVPLDFVGLSYEMQQITAPDFFSAQNKELIAQFRALAPTGMLRLGGNTSDFGYWKPTPDAPMPPRLPEHPFGVVANPDHPFPVTPEGLKRVRGFLDVTDWRCIYGINMATNVPSVAAEEAVAAMSILGPRLECIQIGNEADRYGINFRRDPKTWGPQAYYKEWLTFAQAIVARVPNVRLGMPDLAAKPDWFGAVADALDHHPIRSHVVTLTYHYYEDGPPSNPKMDIPHLLNANADVLKDAGVVRDAAARLRTTWRMTEGNTCWNSGKRGVSDVFAAALWSADYMLLHAWLGCAGINLHGGDSRSFGRTPGAVVQADDHLPAQQADADDHPHPPYTPISFYHGRYVAEPVSIGMRFAGMFAGATMFPVEFDPGKVNATAYAAKDKNGKTLLAIINKGDAGTVDVKVPARQSAKVYRLTGASLDARTAEFSLDAAAVPVRGGVLHLVVPPSVGAIYVYE